MSSWSYVQGYLKVEPAGSGEHAKLFVLNEVLDHMPRVWGSEGDMSWHVVQSNTSTCSRNHDEFGFQTNLGNDGRRWWNEEGNFFVVLEGNLRDTSYESTLKSFTKWIFRLSKRVWIEDMLVRISGCSEKKFEFKKYIFDGPMKLGKNYSLVRREDSDETLNVRRSTNWRYDIQPHRTFWPNCLINLLPDGNYTAKMLDMLNGQLEPEEYMEWDGNEYTDISQWVKDALNSHNENLINVLKFLSKLENKD